MQPAAAVSHLILPTVEERGTVILAVIPNWAKRVRNTTGDSTEWYTDVPIARPSSLSTLRVCCARGFLEIFKHCWSRLNSSSFLPSGSHVPLGQTTDDALGATWCWTSVSVLSEEMSYGSPRVGFSGSWTLCARPRPKLRGSNRTGEELWASSRMHICSGPGGMERRGIVRECCPPKPVPEAGSSDCGSQLCRAWFLLV